MCFVWLTFLNEQNRENDYKYKIKKNFVNLLQKVEEEGLQK